MDLLIEGLSKEAFTLQSFKWWIIYFITKLLIELLCYYYIRRVENLMKLI